MNEHLGLGACRGMANTGCLMVTHHAYESLFSTDGSPLLWVVLRLQPFWGIFTYFFFFVVCFVFPHWYARLYKSHRDVNHRRRRLLCCCHLKGIFLVGVAETIFFFFCTRVTGEGRKGVPAVIGRGRRGPIIHDACYLTQHYWLTVKPELGCISKTSATTWPLFTTEPFFAESQTSKRRAQTQYNTHAAALDRTKDLDPA